MVSVLVTCPRCSRALELDPGRVVVVVPPRPSDGPAELLFLCPSCRRDVALWVMHGLAALLVASGASGLVAVDITVLAPTHPESPPADAPPLILDDLLELHARLDDPAALGSFLADGGSTGCGPA